MSPLRWVLRILLCSCVKKDCTLHSNSSKTWLGLHIFLFRESVKQVLCLLSGIAIMAAVNLIAEWYDGILQFLRPKYQLVICKLKGILSGNLNSTVHILSVTRKVLTIHGPPKSRRKKWQSLLLLKWITALHPLK